MEGSNGRLIDRYSEALIEKLKRSFMGKHVKCRDNLQAMTMFKIFSELGQRFGDYGARRADSGKEFYIRSLISKP